VYGQYLSLDRVLTSQQPRSGDARSDETARSEHFFIVCHQAVELWLKQLLLELAAVECSLQRCQPERAVPAIGRAAGVAAALVQQLAMFQHLSAAEFASFRPLLGTASGAQSEQFADLERVCGTVSGESGIERVLEERCRGDLGSLDLTAACTHALCQCAVGLLLVSDRVSAWREQHVRQVSRLIDNARGTGGTAGATYLSGRRERRCFPRLVALRRSLQQA